jgi:hypothetical protein
MKPELKFELFYSKNTNKKDRFLVQEVNFLCLRERLCCFRLFLDFNPDFEIITSSEPLHVSRSHVSLLASFSPLNLLFMRLNFLRDLDLGILVLYNIKMKKIY